MRNGTRVFIIPLPFFTKLAKQHSNEKLIKTTDRDDVYEKLMEMTKEKRPDSCIDAVGAEAHGDTFVGKAVVFKIYL